MEPSADTTTHTADAAEEAAKRPELTAFGRAVHGQLLWLQRGYVSDPDDPMAVQVLSQLRPGAGRLPEEVPQLLGYDYGLGEVWLEEDAPVRAAHIALTLYARHQQSLRNWDLRMYRWGKPGGQRPPLLHNLGWAVRAVMDEESRPRDAAGGDGGGGVRASARPPVHEPVRQRFVQAGKASDVKTMADRLRGLVDLLHRHRIPLDYAVLAEHLHRAQQPGGLAEVRRSWNFGFNAYRKPDNTDKDAP